MALHVVPGAPDHQRHTNRLRGPFIFFVALIPVSLCTAIPISDCAAPALATPPHLQDNALNAEHAGPGALPFDLKPIEQLIPQITSSDLEFLRAQRPQFERLNAVWQLKGEGRLTEAFEAASALMRDAPDLGPAIDAYVDVAHAAQKLETVVAEFESTTRSAPGHWAGWYGLATARAAAQSWDAALGGSRRAIDASCPYWGCYSIAAKAWQELKRTDEGVLYFRERAAEAGEDRLRAGLAWLGLGDLLNEDFSHWNEAEAALQRAVELLRPGEGWEEAQRTMGILASDSGQPKANMALSLFEQTLAVHRELGDRRGLGRDLGDVGIEWRGSKDPSRAIAFIQEAIKIDQEMGNRRHAGILMGNLANVYGDQKDVKNAVSTYEQALVLLRQEGARRPEGYVLGNLGAAYFNTGEIERAIELYKQAVAIHREVGNQSQEADLLEKLGGAHARLGRLRQAIDFWDQASVVLRAGTDRRREGGFLRRTGNKLRELGELSIGKKYLDQSVIVFQEAQDRGGVTGSIADLGIVLTQQGEVRQGIRLYEQALRDYRGVGDLKGEAIQLTNLGAAYLDLGDAQRGIEYAEQALIAHRTSGDRYREALTLGNLGVAYYQRGDVQRAIPYYVQALDSSRRLKRRQLEGITLSNLGEAHNTAGDSQEAIRYLELALAITREVTDRRTEGIVRSTLGRTYADRGELRLAIQQYEDAIRLHREVGDEIQLEVDLIGAARAYVQVGAKDAALDRVGEALGLVRSLTTSLKDPELESAYFGMSTSPYALQIQLLTSRLDPTLSAPTTAQIIGETFVLGEEARARSFQRRVQLARVDLTKGTPPEILNQVAEANHLLNLVRGFMNEAGSSPIERAVLETWIDERLNPALAHVGSSGGELSPKLRELQRLRQKMAEGELPAPDRQLLLKELLESCEQNYADAERALREAAPAYRRVMAPALVSLEQIQESLDPGTVLLGYLLGEDASFGWIVTRTERRVLRLPAEKEITSKVESLRILLADPERTTTEIAAQARPLHQLLVAPASDLIPPGTELVIVPDGSLGALPFETLVTREPGQTGDPPAWLALEHPISYAPSATAWWEGRQRTTPNRKDGPMLLVGDPVYHEDRCGRREQLLAARGPESRAGVLGETWTRLCYAQDEAARITRARRQGLLPHRGDVLLLGRHATEREWRSQPLNRFSILHFATHAVAWNDVPLRSAVVLSQQSELVVNDSRPPDRTTPELGEAGDGYLDLREIANLSIPAELVILSACDTAKGRSRRGEGVESLARGFLIAGARAVVASQWAVRDESTAEFMDRFYRAMRDMTPAEALRTARRAFIGAGSSPISTRPDRPEYAHPYYWAPFVLIEGGGAVSETARP